MKYWFPSLNSRKCCSPFRRCRKYFQPPPNIYIWQFSDKILHQVNFSADGLAFPLQLHSDIFHRCDAIRIGCKAVSFLFSLLDVGFYSTLSSNNISNQRLPLTPAKDLLKPDSLISSTDEALVPWKSRFSLSLPAPAVFSMLSFFAMKDL